MASHTIEPHPIKPQAKIASVFLSLSCSLSVSEMMRSLRPWSQERLSPDIVPPWGLQHGSLAYPGDLRVGLFNSTECPRTLPPAGNSPGMRQGGASPSRPRLLLPAANRLEY